MASYLFFILVERMLMPKAKQPAARTNNMNEPTDDKCEMAIPNNNNKKTSSNTAASSNFFVTF